MRVVLNKMPTTQYSKEPYKGLMEEGYALPIETQGNATILLFKDVDDHIDGNGLAVLWLMEGGGTFFHDGAPIVMKTGDVVVFDDNIEHGFEADNYCLAANFEIGPQQDLHPLSIATILDAFEALHRERTTALAISGASQSF